MNRFPKFRFGLAAAIVFCACLTAQPRRRWSSIFRRAQHRNTSIQAGQSPFLLGQEAPPISTDVRFRSPDQIAEADRALEAKSHVAIAQHAGLANFQLSEGNWSYRQIDCRAFPNHLFLRFIRDTGPGDRSVFSVSIPRLGQGRLQVIPVLRRGYSLFSPAPGNKGTIAAFNRIRLEDGPHPKIGWLETALCYAALAGADPGIGPLTGDAVVDDPSPPLAEMQVLLDGGAIVRFTDEAALPHPELWSLTFGPAGDLLRVVREPAVINTRWVVPKGWRPKSVAHPATVEQLDTSDQPGSESKTQTVQKAGER